MYVGITKEEIETPALLIDVDIMEKNIRTMADYYQSKKHAALRPHQKGHRLPIIARKQLDAGATGVSITSLGLAEFYVSSGIDDILITNEICGASKIRRLCALSKHSNVTIGVDDIENVRQLSDAAIANDTKINVAAELYMGRATCGVELEKTKQFAKQVEKYRGVIFKGLWWHEDLFGARSLDERRRVHFELLDRIRALKDEIEDAGMAVQMLSGGHTWSWNITPEYTGLSKVEVQAGSYVFSDWCLRGVEGFESFECALTVLTRCISRPKPNEAMFDFGMNSCTDECGHDYHNIVGPKFKDLVGVEEVFEREELSFAVLQDETKVHVGDLFEVIPPHCDTTAKLYDKYYAMRDGKVEAVWINYGRGLL
jgi:D-serine deaminase-like pyridoxal phosphate-dependent protein